MDWISIRAPQNLLTDWGLAVVKRAPFIHGRERTRRAWRRAHCWPMSASSRASTATTGRWPVPTALHCKPVRQQHLKRAGHGPLRRRHKPRCSEGRACSAALQRPTKEKPPGAASPRGFFRVRGSLTSAELSHQKPLQPSRVSSWLWGYQDPS